MANYTLVPPEVMDPSKGAFLRKGEQVGRWGGPFLGLARADGQSLGILREAPGWPEPAGC